MSFLKAVQLDDNFGPFVAFQEALGFVPNLLHAQTLLPRVIEAQTKLETVVRLREGALSRIQKEHILLSVAADRQDTYCVAVDSNVLSSLGASRGQIDDFLNDYRHTDLSAPDLASVQFCLKLSRHAPSVRSEDIERFERADSTTSRYLKLSSWPPWPSTAARYRWVWVRRASTKRRKCLGSQ
jgi:alkylhydroperoxidase family enzyme